MSGIPINRDLTPGEARFISQLSAVAPHAFIASAPPGPETNVRLLGMGALALTDYNNFPPEEDYNFSSLPQRLVPLISLGTVNYMMAFRAADFSLIDVQYSDMGLSISLDRVGKITQALANIEKLWLRQLENAKKIVTLHVAGQAPGLGTPRFQSNLSRFIAILGGGAYGWNIP